MMKELHWRDLIAGLEVGFFMEMVNQNDLTKKGVSMCNAVILYILIKT